MLGVEPAFNNVECQFHGVMLLLQVNQGDKLLGIAVDVLVPLHYPSVVPTLHAFNRDMNQVLVVVRQ